MTFIIKNQNNISYHWLSIYFVKHHMLKTESGAGVPYKY